MSIDVNIQGDIMRLFIESMPSRNSFIPIYHYTSASGLLNIINENKLWFTRYDCLNDPTEREYILDVLKSVCKEMYDSNEIDKNTYDDIIEWEIDKKEWISYQDEKFHYGEFDSEYYICCFSRNRDSLPMWNYYSKGSKYEGYNLEFCHDVFDCFPLYWQNCNFKTLDIEYDKEEQKKIIHNFIKKLMLIINYPNNLNTFKINLYGFIKGYALAFKKSCFAHEKETRIVLTIPKDGNKYFPIKYRVSNGCIVPYIECEFEKRLMTGVTIGPLVNAKISEDTLCRLLSEKGYRFDNIVKSKVPIRF